MAFNLRRFAKKLLAAKTGDEITALLASLPSEFRWRLVGDLVGNMGAIHSGVDQMKALIERIINAQDTLNRRWMKEGGKTAADFVYPRDVADFFVPEFKDRGGNILLYVSLPYMKAGSFTSKDYGRAVVDVLDYGEGIAPERFSSTILSLLQSTKVGEQTIGEGVNGTGGSSTLAFLARDGSGYAVIFSRDAYSGRIGFTVVQLVYPEPGEHAREAFKYLVDAHGQVLSIEASPCKRPKRITVPKSPEEFVQGTLVRHFNYNLSQYSQVKYSSDRSIYSACQAFIPTPSHPIAVEVEGTDHRGAERRIVNGLTRQLGDDSPLKAARRHSMVHPDIKIGYKVENATTKVVSTVDCGKVSLSYYVVSPTKDKGRDSQCFVPHKSLTVFITSDGHAHGETSLGTLSRALRQRYQLIGTNLIVVIALDDLTDMERSLIITANRQVVYGEELQRVFDACAGHLLSDPVLSTIEEEIRSAIVKNTDNPDEDAQSFKEGQKLLTDNLGDLARYLEGGKISVDRRFVPLEPFKPHKGGPTFVEPCQSSDTFVIHPGTTRYIYFTTDAPNNWKRPGIECEARDDRSKLKKESISEVTDGRFCLTVSCPEDATVIPPDEKYQLQVSGRIPVSYGRGVFTRLFYRIEAAAEAVNRPEGASSKPPRKAKGGGGPVQLIQPDMRDFGRADDKYWELEVLNLGGIPREEAVATFAYHIQVGSNGTSTVYYNTDFPIYAQIISKYTGKKQRYLIAEYRRNLQIDAMLLAKSGPDVFLPPDNPEQAAAYYLQMRRYSASRAGAVLAGAVRRLEDLRNGPALLEEEAAA